MSNRFELVEEPYNVFIRDVEHGLNLAVLCESGMGLPATNARLGQRIVDYLNALPEEETRIYPHDRS